MKEIKILIAFLLITISISAQNSSPSDVGRIILNSVILEKENKIPEEAKSSLLNKLTQIAANNGIGGNSISPRFIIASKINVTSKDIVAGPPQMIALNLEVFFFIGDAIENNIYANTSVTLKGVGINENKAFIDAIKNINVKNKQFSELTSSGKNKIVEYYENKCDFILKKAEELSNQLKFESAIYELMQIPEVNKNCYIKCIDAVGAIYKKMIDRNCNLNLNDAKAKWNVNQNSKGAEEVGKILAQIEPNAECFKEAFQLSETIRKKIEADEKRDWDFKMQQNKDAKELEKQQLEAARAVAITYLKNQPKTIVYNTLLW